MNGPTEHPDNIQRTYQEAAVVMETSSIFPNAYTISCDDVLSIATPLLWSELHPSKLVLIAARMAWRISDVIE
jgi:hypothetical protein